jgi:hypothetical protein
LQTIKNKIWLGWCAFLFVVFHFTCLFFSALPSRFSNQKMKQVADFYIEPVFSQSWGMFVPTPIIDGHVEIKFYFEQDSTDWIAPTEDARKIHSFFPGTWNEELIIGESNLIYYLNVDLVEMGWEMGEPFPDELMERFHKGYSFFKIKYYIQGYGRYLFDRTPSKALFRCYLRDVVAKKSGLVELPMFEF